MDAGAAAASLSPLARRLYNFDDIEQRLVLGSDAALLCRGLAELYAASAAWDRLAKWLGRIVEHQLPTLLYGDYDVDGSCSVFLLHRWLKAQGVPGNWFLPSRFTTGYGLDKGNLAKALAHGYKAVIALDCGTTSVDEVAMLRAGGVEVAIIDHHTPKAELPDACIFNPHLDPGLPMLCTAGLVYGALCALWQDPRYSEARYGDEVEAAGLATIADVAPLNPWGWAMAHHALLTLPQTLNLGLSELQKVARLHGLERLTARNIGFDLAPRLNAAGRMQHARWVPELLLARDATAARELALRLDRLNEERKSEAKRVTEQALRQALSFGEDSGLVLADSQWHPGVLGIVAARVSEHLGKPSIVLGSAPGDTGAASAAAGDELLSGSVRSALGLDLQPALAACGAILYSFGGHAAAAGVKVLRSRLPELRAAFSAALSEQLEQRQAAESAESETAGGEYARGAVQWPEVQLGELSAAFEQDVWRLTPGGPDFAAPRCILRGLRVARVSYMGAERTHLNLLLTDGAAELRVAGFNMSHLYYKLTPGQAVSPLVEIDADNWNNRIGISLKLIELL